MANPFYASGFVKEMARGDALRRDVAQQFLEFRRLNPEATAQDMRDFLTASAGQFNPHVQYDDDYLKRIATQNAQTKATRQADEAAQRMARDAQLRSAIQTNYVDNFAQTGDHAKAAEMTSAMFGGTPEAQQMVKNTIVEPDALIAKSADKAWAEYAPGIEQRFKLGEKAEDIAKDVPSWLVPKFKSMASFYAGKQNEESLQKEADRRDRLDQIAQLMTVSKLPPEELRKRGYRDEDIQDAIGIAQQNIGVMADSWLQSELPKVGEQAEAAGKKQVDDLAIDKLTAKGSLYEQSPWITQAARDIAYNYALTPGQLAALKSTLYSSIKAKTYDDARRQLWAATIGNSQRPASLRDYYTQSIQDQYAAKKPVDFKTALNMKDNEAQRGFSRFQNTIAAFRSDKMDSRAGASLMAESQKLRAWAAEARNSMLGVRSSMYGDANPYDEAAARAAADTWYQKALELADQAEAEANKRLAGKAPNAENIGYHDAVKSPETAQAYRDAQIAKGERFWDGVGNFFGVSEEAHQRQTNQRIALLRQLRNQAIISGDKRAAQRWQDELKKLGAN